MKTLIGILLIAVLNGSVISRTTSEPVGWATVALMKADSTIVAGTTSNEQGEYVLNAAEGEYILTASLIGYKEYSQPVQLVPGTNALPPILLETDSQMLTGASVTENVKLVEVKIDKVVMNVRESAFAQGSNALELIRKAPGVTIDKDGNVMLNGKKVSVWIDGRPSYADGKALESLLRSTNGESIDKFELIEHPSSKYDASGQGGIIDIKTKKNFLQGFNGSLGLGGGGMYYRKKGQAPWEESAWANLAYRSGKTNTFLNIYEGTYFCPIEILNDMSIGSLNFRQSGSTMLESLYHNYNVKVGNDWFIDKKNTFGVILFVPGSYSTINSEYSNTRQMIGETLTSESVTDIKNGPGRSTRANLNLNYTHVFDEARSAELTANLDYCNNTSHEDNRQTDNTTVPGMPAAVTEQSIVSDNIYDIYSAKVDYQSVVWKKFMLEAGAKWALSRTNNNSLEVFTLGAPSPSEFVYSENVGAVYASLAGQLGPKWSFKAGLRGEYTHSIGDWKTDVPRTEHKYFDPFPTVYIGFTPNQKWRLSVSYSRRISRPYYDVLNPTKTYIDAKTYTMGDPDILPQYSNSTAFSAGLGQHLSLSMGYNSTNNYINQIPSFHADGTQCMKFGNAGTQNIGFMSLNIAALPIGKWLQWTFNAFGMYGEVTSNVSGIGYKSLGAALYTAFTFTLPKDWKIDLDGHYSTPMTVGYFRIHRQWDSNMAIKKTLLDNKLVLALKVEDIFRSSANDLDILDESGSGAVTTIQQKYYSQQILLDITWHFGNARNQSGRRKVGELEEMSRVGGGGGTGGTGSIGM